MFTGFTLPTNGAPFQIRVTNVRVSANQSAPGSFITATVLATFPIQVSVRSPLAAVPQCQAQISSFSNLTIHELVNTAFKSPAATAANSTTGQWYQNGVNTESQTVLASQLPGWTNQKNAAPGQADAGTRLRINLINIPLGATVTMPISISNGFGASLVAHATGDLGPFSAAAGGGDRTAPVRAVTSFRI